MRTWTGPPPLRTKAALLLHRAATIFENVAEGLAGIEPATPALGRRRSIH